MHEICGTVMPIWRPYQVGTLELVLINTNQLFTLGTNKIRNARVFQNTFVFSKSDRTFGVNTFRFLGRRQLDRVQNSPSQGFVPRCIQR